ncbi:vanadium-dependent haloperoxidase [Flavitalea antarctica]
MKKQRTSLLLCAVALLVFFPACEKSDPNDPPVIPCGDACAAQETAEVPITWYKFSFNFLSSIPFQPGGPVSARTYACMGVALYEAVVPGMPKYQSIQSQLNELPVLPRPDLTKKYYYPACANAALSQMLDNITLNATPQQKGRIDSLENVFATSFQSTVPKDVLDRSAEFGKAVANAVYAWSTTDGGADDIFNWYPTSYNPPVGPGLWTPQPGQLAILPYWGSLRPFVPNNVDRTQPAPPPTYSADPNSQLYKEQMAVYTESKNQTAEHQQIARYWNTGPGSYGSISVLNNILSNKSANLATAAEAYCKAGIAIHDANISCFKTKYTYNQERPITYIRTHIDPKWSPLLMTPPQPDYTNGIPCQSAANATVLTALFGNRTTFTNDFINDNFGLTPRIYHSFSQYVEEVALSGFYGGIDIPISNQMAVVQGNRVGANVNALRFRRK